MAGWIKLHRSIIQSWIYDEKPFCRMSAWIDLLMKVNHEDGKTLFDGNLLEVKRGSRITSIRKLCVDWGWSTSKVIKFLDVLQNEGKILKKSDSKKTLITILKYDVFQEKENEKETVKKHRNDTEMTLKKTNNNNTRIIKNDKEVYCFAKIAKRIIEHLNKLIGTDYRHTTKQTQQNISARLKEGYTENDFIMVHEHQYKQWKDTEWEKFLRPSTLYTPTNFEKYLNDAKKNKAGLQPSKAIPELTEHDRKLREKYKHLFEDKK